MKKAPYKTKQIQVLLAYMQSLQGKHITVNDVSSYFAQQGIEIGTTTIYRNLERMVEQGIVAKYVVDGTTSACFEYLGEQECCKKPVCYHCKCEKCGKVIHMQCEEVSALGQHMKEHHDFEMDSVRTVFYGICKECRKSKIE